MPSPSPKRRSRPGKGGSNPKQNNSGGSIKPRRAGAQAAQLVADPRFRRRVQHLERFGSRVTGELLAHLAVEHDCRAEIESFCDRIVENESAIRKLGFDQWPELPLRAVPR